MRRVGDVVRTAQRLAVARSDDETHPAPGTTVLTERLEEVGTVVDVFGPVDRPYVAVSAADAGSLPELLGTTLYVR